MSSTAESCIQCFPALQNSSRYTFLCLFYTEIALKWYMENMFFSLLYWVCVDLAMWDEFLLQIFLFYCITLSQGGAVMSVSDSKHAALILTKCSNVAFVVIIFFLTLQNDSQLQIMCSNLLTDCFLWQTCLSMWWFV